MRNTICPNSGHRKIFRSLLSISDGETKNS